MPTTFTHGRFGKDVYVKLPEDIQDVIRANKKLYLIGLHGPDIFLYFFPFWENTTFRLGMDLHQEDADKFFQRGIELYKEKPSQPLLAYLLGFACHFMLDSTCHPFIYEYQHEHKLTHSEIESAIDKYQMLACGKDPFHYHPAAAICPRFPNLKEILVLFPQITMPKLTFALKSMKFFTNICIVDNILKRKMIYRIMKVAGVFDEMSGRIIQDEDKEACLGAVDKVNRKLYPRALEETPSILENLYFSMTGNQSLSSRFKRNYNDSIINTQEDS